MSPRLFDRRPLTALQVEVTSRCTRQCAICPRTVLAPIWRDGDLGDAGWDRLRNDLNLARLVHLQGWGEPLLHPRLLGMVDDAKAAGCDVSITTNGDLLDDAIDWVVSRRVDMVTVSAAGDAATHADLCSGSPLEALWETVARLVARRGRRKAPRVKVSYLLTRKSSEQMARVVRAAARAGADEFFVIHLDCTPSLELLRLAAFDASGVDPSAADAIEEARRAARSCKIAFRAPALAEERPLVCSLNPLSFVFVSWDGKVGPCVNLGLPVQGPIPRCVDDGPTDVERFVFGDLAESGLGEILDGERFRSFARSFESRIAAERRFLEEVAGRNILDALQYLDKAERQREKDLAANPFPKACSGCHKAVGW